MPTLMPCCIMLTVLLLTKLGCMLQFPSSYMARDEEASELVLNMADVSTNLVMLTGKACVFWELLHLQTSS